MDLQQCGSLDTYTIRYFLSKILERMTELGGDAGNIQNVHSEIVDMIKPADPEYITLEDVLSHESGGVFLRYFAFLLVNLIFNKTLVDCSWTLMGIGHMKVETQHPTLLFEVDCAFWKLCLQQCRTKLAMGIMSVLYINMNLFHVS